MLEPIPLQRVEGATILILSMLGFAASDLSWWWFAGMLLSVDLFMIGYIRDNSLGAKVYNVGHSLVGPSLAISLWLIWQQPSWLLALGCIWAGHVGFDRMLGYGLKHSDSFHHTHLGWIKAPPTN